MLSLEAQRGAALACSHTVPGRTLPAPEPSLGARLPWQGCWPLASGLLTPLGLLSRWCGPRNVRSRGELGGAVAPRTPPCLAQRPPPHAHFRQRVFSGAPARLRPPCGHKWCWDWPVPSRARTCVLSPGTCGPGAPRPARPPSPPAAAEAGLPGRREEALAWLLEKPRICSKCKQQVILSLPPSPGGVDTFDIGGDGVGGRLRVWVFLTCFSRPRCHPGCGARVAVQAAATCAGPPGWHARSTPRRPRGARAGGGCGGPPSRPTRPSPVPARASCADKMAAEAGRSIWNPGEGEWRKWPPEQ